MDVLTHLPTLNSATGFWSPGRNPRTLFRQGALLSLSLLFSTLALCGPYPPKAGEAGTTAIHMSDTELRAWAAGYEGLVYGSHVDATYKTPDKAVGAATGNSADIVSLGRGGTITMTFSTPLRDGEGWDFSVFENAFNDTFLELAYVEVSSNGTDFVRFDSNSKTGSPVGEFGSVDPTDIRGLAGKYRRAYGTPFNLRDLVSKPLVTSCQVNLSAITHIRLIDIVGDGNHPDSEGNPIYDPYPTNGSAGFDLEAVGIRYEGGSGSNATPDTPELLSPADGSIDTSLSPLLRARAFHDDDAGDTHLLSRWQLATRSDFTTDSLALNLTSSVFLSSLRIPALYLDPDTLYYWRVSYYDGSCSMALSDAFDFTTTATPLPSQEIQWDWDGDGVNDPTVHTVKAVNSDGERLPVGLQAVENVSSISAVRVLDIDSTDLTGDSKKPDRFPFGGIISKFPVTTAGTLAKVTLFLPSAAESGAKVYGFNPLVGWRSEPHATFNAERTRVTLLARDGSTEDGDMDGARNGSILMVVAVGADKVATPPAENGKSGLGEEGGCFISVISSPVSIGERICFLLGAVVLSLIVTLASTLRESSRGKSDKE